MLATGPARAKLAFAAAVVAATALLPALATADVAPARQISVDPFVFGPGQHETAVEPDSISFGNTVVGVFQVGRFPTGGASGIGWATSTDGGATWASGVLPALTVQAPSPGPFSRASDPAVAYDRMHGTFLANVLALRDSGASDPPTKFVPDPARTGRRVVVVGETFAVPGAFSVRYARLDDLDFAWTDRVRPTRPALTSPASRVQAGRPFRVTWKTSRDTGSGLAFCLVRIDARTVARVEESASTTAPALSTGYHRVSVACTDRARNQSRAATRRIRAFRG